MNIAVIATGGTICCENINGVLTPAKTIPKKISEQLSCYSHNFTITHPLNILSECISFDDINQIAECVKMYQTDFDGVIILHGTDTLSYSASALGYIFSRAKIPIIYVSSGHILTDSRANGLNNLKTAIKFIEQNSGSGVFVVWNNTIHRATRLIPHTVYSDECESLLSLPYATLIDEKIIKNPDYTESQDKANAYAKLSKRKILQIPALAEIDYSVYDTDIDAVLHTSYHSGTIDTTNKSFIAFCEKLKSKSIPLYLHGSYEGSNYQSKQAFDELGIITTPIISPIALYMKLHLADFCDVGKSIAGDII